MTDQRRLQLGIIGVGVGAVLFFVGVLIAHFTALSLTNDVGQEIYPHIPRCAFFENDPTKCWVLPTTGQLIAFAGSQVFLAGVVLGWIVERPLTWARASVAAFLFTLEMLIIFGVVPNQWLNLTQGTFEWTDQNIALTLPKWLMLNNEVSISYAVIKDAVSGGYSAVMLGAVAVGAYQLQEWNKRRGQPRPLKLSSYGRPVVKSGR